MLAQQREGEEGCGSAGGNCTGAAEGPVPAAGRGAAAGAGRKLERTDPSEQHDVCHRGRCAAVDPWDSRMAVDIHAAGIQAAAADHTVVRIAEAPVKFDQNRERTWGPAGGEAAEAAPTAGPGWPEP